MPRGRVLIGLGIVAFWAVMMALLLQREVLIPRATPGVSSLPVGMRPATDTWMGVYSKNALGDEDRVGYVHLTSTPGQRGADTGMRQGMTLRLDTRMLNDPVDLLLDGSAWVVDGRGLSEFEFRVQSSGQHILQANGNLADGRMKLEVESAGETFPIDFPVGQDLMLQGAFGATSMNIPSLEVGDMVLIDAFDPLTLSKGVATVECVGTEVLAYDGEEVATKVLTIELGGVKTKTWVALNEQIMQVEAPVGLVLRRIPQSEALADIEDSDSSELLHSVAVRPSGARPMRGAQEMQIRVGGLADGVYIPLDELQQFVEGDVYRILAAPMPEPPVEIPDPAALEKYLAGDPFVQSGSPRIVQHARAIVGEEIDIWRKSILIYQWVYDNIAKEPLLSIPSAVDVLENRTGDCNEHTVLFAALARAEGIPTRIALGLVWSDELRGFYYHAWPEVYAGRWVPMDPTLGQPVADATHIKLLEGSVAEWPRLMPFLGQVSIDVVDVR